MKRCYFVVVTALAFGVASPATAQFVYLDADEDGVCSTGDYLDATSTHLDVYIDTNRTAEGFVTECVTDEAIPIDLSSYSFILQKVEYGYGPITFGAWADSLGYSVGITDSGARMENDTELWIGLTGGPVLPAGKHKLGRLSVTIAGPVRVMILPSSSLSPRAATSFGTSCPGLDSDHTMQLGVDFLDVCGVGASPDGTSVTNTTWGRIKAAYR